MGRAILAVFAGYAAMSLLVVATMGFLLFTAPGSFPRPGERWNPHAFWFILVLALNVPSAAVGGFVTARLGSGDPARHVSVLATVVAVLSVVSAFAERGAAPLWFLALTPASGIGGIYLGYRLYVGPEVSPTRAGSRPSVADRPA